MATISNNEIKIKYSLDTTDLANATALFDRLSAEDRQLLNDLKKLQAQLNATGQTGQQAGNNIRNGLRGATDDTIKLGVSVKQIGQYIATYFSAQAIISFGRSVLDTTIKMEGLRKAIEFTSKSVIGGQANFEFLRETAEKFGIPLEAAAEGFKSLSAAASRSGISMALQRKMFTDLSAAMSALSLSSQDASLIFFGFGQLMAKSKVSAQELYHQIGERLPIAMEAAQIAAAKVTGQVKVTSAQLIKLVEDGKLISSEFAPAFTEALGKIAESGAYIETLGKDVTRLETSWNEFKASLGDNKAINFLVKSMTEWSRTLNLAADVLGYYLGFKFLDTGKTLAEYNQFQENLLNVYNGIIDGAELRFTDLNKINSEYIKVINDQTIEGERKRKELETEFTKERISVVNELSSEIKKRENEILGFKKDILEKEKAIRERDYYDISSGRTAAWKREINQDKDRIAQAESALNALKSIFATIPELKTLLPDPDAEKKKLKDLEDLYRKLIAQQEALKQAEDDRIKARTVSGYTRDIELLKNNVRFNNEMLKIDERAEFQKLELARNNAVKRRGENERDQAEQIKIRQKALQESQDIESKYIEKNLKALQEDQAKRKAARQSDFENEKDEISKRKNERLDALTNELNEALAIQELSDARRKELLNNYNNEVTKITKSSLNDQLLLLKQFYADQRRLNEENESDVASIYARANTQKMAALAQNEKDRQDILSQGEQAQITIEKNRLSKQEANLNELYKQRIIKEDEYQREIRKIRAKEYELQQNSDILRIEDEKRKWEQIIEIVQASSNAISQILNDATNLYISNLDREKDALNKKYDSDVRLAGENKQKLTELEQEKARAEYEIELKQFKARQFMAVAEVIFKTAPEIAKWISTGVLAPVAAIGLAAQAAAIGMILSQPPPVPPYKDGTKGRPHPGGPAIVGEAGTEKVVTTDGKVYFTPPTATLIDLPKGAQVIPNHALSKKELFWANALNDGKPINPNGGLERKLDKIGGILEALPVHQINMNEKGFEKFVRTPRRTTKILNNQFPVKH